MVLRRITLEVTIDEEGKPVGFTCCLYDDNGQGAILDAQETDGWAWWTHLGTRLKALSPTSQFADIPR